MAEISLREKMARMIAERLDPEAGSAVGSAAQKARASFKGFINHVMPEYEFNWHHEVFCAAIQRWIDRKTNRLMIFASPQSGKSLLVSRLLPAYLLALNPDEALVASSFNSEYATKNNLDVQRIMDSERYREAFPMTRIPGGGKGEKGWKRNARTFEVVGRKGVYFCGGVGAGLSGRPFYSAILDDVYKDYVEANSPATLSSVFDWYTTVFLARKSIANARIIFINTRWSLRDLAGTLLEFARTDPAADQWDVVSFPALLESEEQRNPGDPRKVGEALWPSRQSAAELENTRAISGTAKWSSVYQQDPTPDKGTYFIRANFRYFWTEVDAKGILFLVLDDGLGRELRRFAASDCLWFQTCDAADTTNVRSDWTAVGTFLRTPEADLCCWHYYRVKIDYPKRYKFVTSMRDCPPDESPWPIRLAFQSMENKASGTAMIQQAAADGIPFRPLKPGTNSKVQRVSTVVTMYENGKVFHRNGRVWTHSVEKSLCEFPAGRHDEEADVFGYAGIVCLQQSATGKLDGELVLGFDPPREKDGSVSLKNTSLDFEFRGVKVGRYFVDFDDDD